MQLGGAVRDDEIEVFVEVDELVEAVEVHDGRLHQTRRMPLSLVEHLNGQVREAIARESRPTLPPPPPEPQKR